MSTWVTDSSDTKVQKYLSAVENVPLHDSILKLILPNPAFRFSISAAPGHRLSIWINNGENEIIIIIIIMININYW